MATLRDNYPRPVEQQRRLESAVEHSRRSIGETLSYRTADQIAAQLRGVVSHITAHGKAAIIEAWDAATRQDMASRYSALRDAAIALDSAYGDANDQRYIPTVAELPDSPSA